MRSDIARPELKAWEPILAEAAQAFKEAKRQMAEVRDGFVESFSPVEKDDVLEIDEHTKIKVFEVKLVNSPLSTLGHRWRIRGWELNKLGQKTMRVKAVYHPINWAVEVQSEPLENEVGKA